ncbi:MAG TPA: hypothetical protein VJ933_05760, partial [Phaeodactylibacter sp.]|nr:hypothetical protein [Phaeodactylibacter sp.]
MPHTYTTTTDNTYYIKVRRTKKGNPSYYLTRKKDEDCLDIMPAGYEIFEKYDTGQAFIRKVKKSHIEGREVEIIKQELRKNKSLHDFKLDICGDEIRIYVKTRGTNTEVSEILRGLGREAPEAVWSKFIRYEEQMRIMLTQHKNKREFTFLRYCYRSSVDDWIEIEAGSDVAALAKNNLFHLG